ncbi:hypothetical protein E4U41_003079 [Claviceps citrina]|nr:hypothetical protein E4U41_003079 [Claviceps citrina]
MPTLLDADRHADDGGLGLKQKAALHLPSRTKAPRRLGPELLARGRHAAVSGWFFIIERIAAKSPGSHQAAAKLPSSTKVDGCCTTF